MSQGGDAAPRIAIAGAGLMGRWHADAASRAGGRIVGVCDSDRATARSLATRVAAAHVETNLDALLAAATPDIVHICTPLESHASLCERALVAGADVIAEKPLAEDAGTTERLLSLARERGIPMVLGVLNATRRIPDGGQVAVDGVAGVVRWIP